MFEIRIICDQQDIVEISKTLSRAFTTGAYRTHPTRDGRRARVYVTADHRPGEPTAVEWADAETAYAGAPSIVKEMGNVLELSMQLNRPGGRTPAAEREQQLRKAALLDRIALDESATFAPDVAADAVETAEAAAIAFALADHAHGHGNQPTGPKAKHWAKTTYRGYVRQEYAIWQQICVCDDFGEGPCPAHPSLDA